MFDRRTILSTAGAVLGTSLVNGQLLAEPRETVLINRECADTGKTRLAVRELSAGLRALGLASSVAEAPGGFSRSGRRITLAVTSGTASENHTIELRAGVIFLRSTTEQGLLNAVFDFLERQGTVFGLDGTIIPADLPRKWTLPTEGQAWESSPLFSTRGLLPWPDFLNGISVFNKEDLRAYFAAMLRIRCNMFSMHVYTDDEQPTESYSPSISAEPGTRRSWKQAR